LSRNGQFSTKEATKFSTKILKRGFWDKPLATLVTLIAIFYTEEDWRGRHAWNRHVRDHAAKGEQLDLSAFIPPTVPDDQNFCMCPLLRPILDFKRVDGLIIWGDTNGIARVQALRPWLTPDQSPTTVTNGLIGWQAYYRLTDDGGFLLYSVGWNETDDGGVTARKSDGQADIEQGDWVWGPL
jgi:hypothetical protein